MIPDPTSGAPPEGDDLAALVHAAAAGDRQAFGVLYRRFAPMVHAVCLSHANEDDVPDLVQDVFVTALRRLDTLRDPAALGPWLATIARNAARMAHRRHVRLVPLDQDVPQSEKTPAELDGRTVLTAIRQLPDAYRETLMLRLLQGLSGQEIAERTGLTPGSVRVNLHRGMALLREKLRGTT